jgi:hypothetical protein
MGSFRFCGSCAFDFDADPQHPVHRAAIWPEEEVEERVVEAPSPPPPAAPGTAAIATAPATPQPATVQTMVVSAPVAPPAPPVAPPLEPSPEPVAQAIPKAEPVVAEPGPTIPEPGPAIPQPDLAIPESAPEQPARPPTPAAERHPATAPQVREPDASAAEPSPGVAVLPAVVRTPAPFRRPTISPETGRRARRRGGWVLSALGAVAILFAIGALSASALLSPRSSAPSSVSPPSATPPASAALPSGSLVAGTSRIVISEPENGARIEGSAVTFRGTGPAGREIVHKQTDGTDSRTLINPDGTWVLDVTLVSGANEVTLRIDDDPSTELTWTVTSAGPPQSPAAVEFKPVTLRGQGAQVVHFSIPTGTHAIADISHRGPSTFRVWTLDSANAQTDQLVSATGNYNGRRLFGGEAPAFGFRVQADGAWTIVVRPMSSATKWDGSGTLEGTGSDVFVLDPPASTFRSATLRHTGQGPFNVVGYAPEGVDTHAAAVGNYFGESLLREGTTILSVEAGGRWSIVLD